MAPSKKTWIWIIVGVFGAGVLLLFVVAGMGVYFVTRHVSTSHSTGSDALQSFERARAGFKDQKPLIEIDSYDRPQATRRVAEMPTSAIKPESLWVLAWDPTDERIVKVSLPFWILKLGKRKLDVTGGDRGFDLERLNLDVYELERIGPALVLDARSPSGERVLVWTQ